MASRRTAPGEKAALASGERELRPGRAPAPSGEGESVPLDVILKMLGFTFAMVTGPLSTYYLTLNYLYKGNSTYAGATAAVMANVVLFAYVFVAMREDRGEPAAAVGHEKKAS